MVEAAPRIDRRLIAALAVLDDTREPMAEINRRVGALARELELPHPSYAQIRRLLLAERFERAERRERRARAAEEIVRRRHPYEFLAR